MERHTLVVLLTVFTVLGLSACSAMTERALQQEQKNGAHFATWEHMDYSLFRATPQKTTKQDIAEAKQEKWWGDPVRVAPVM